MEPTSPASAFLGGLTRRGPRGALMPDWYWSLVDDRRRRCAPPSADDSIYVTINGKRWAGVGSIELDFVVPEDMPGAPVDDEDHDDWSWADDIPALPRWPRWAPAAAAAAAAVTLIALLRRNR